MNDPIEVSRVSETECEIAYSDASGVTCFALVDEAKGRAELLAPAKGGAS